MAKKAKGGNGVKKQKKRRARPNSQLTHKMRAKGYLLATEVATRVGVHKATVYRWINDGIIEALDFNGAYYIKWSSVREHMGELADILGLEETAEASVHG